MELVATLQAPYFSPEKAGGGLPLEGEGEGEGGTAADDDGDTFVDGAVAASDEGSAVPFIMVEDETRGHGRGVEPVADTGEGTVVEWGNMVGGQLGGGEAPLTLSATRATTQRKDWASQLGLGPELAVFRGEETRAPRPGSRSDAYYLSSSDEEVEGEGEGGDSLVKTVAYKTQETIGFVPSAPSKTFCIPPPMRFDKKPEQNTVQFATRSPDTLARVAQERRERAAAQVKALNNVPLVASMATAAADDEASTDSDDGRPPPLEPTPPPGDGRLLASPIRPNLHRKLHDPRDQPVSPRRTDLAIPPHDAAAVKKVVDHVYTHITLADLHTQKTLAKAGKTNPTAPAFMTQTVTSAFRPRLTHADSKDYFDTELVRERAMVMDWQRLLREPRFFTFLSRASDSVDGHHTLKEKRQLHVTAADDGSFYESDAAKAPLKATMVDILRAIHGFFPTFLFIFDHYCAIAGATGPGAFSIRHNSFAKFLRDTRVCDSPECTPEMASVIFLTVNNESTSEKSPRIIDQAHFRAERSRPFRRPDLNDENDDHALMRFEFLESLVRIAVLKYGHSHHHQPGDTSASLAAGSVVSAMSYLPQPTNVDVGRCCELLFEEITASLPPDARIDPNQFRCDRLYFQGVEAVFRRLSRDLRVVYDRYSCRTARGGPKDEQQVHRSFDANVTPGSPRSMKTGFGLSEALALMADTKFIGHR